MNPKFPIKYYLIAPCGMNCAICMAYLKEKNKCPGCRDFNKDEPISIARCKIKNCEFLKIKKLKYCFECRDFPCGKIKHMDKRYQTKYHMSIIENLNNIKNSGIRDFIKNEKIRWACPQCGGPICVHRGLCYNCGKKIW
ncbi:MAG: hypothetical protein AYK22_02415 [Thermoplasmatales archaeon SG8-52-3]|nr:MAG: hypothetical protein AYK22_02415 [Thermoplasmatales archaeon SG8-52-3]